MASWYSILTIQSCNNPAIESIDGDEAHASSCDREWAKKIEPKPKQVNVCDSRMRGIDNGGAKKNYEVKLGRV